MSSTEATGKIVLRPYQEEAKLEFWNHIQTRDDSPCVVIPTGGGKSPLMAAICHDAVSLWDGRVLILAHVKELLEQTADKLHRFGLEEHVGIYSAGLKRRDTDSQILVAGIQSVYERACELGPFDLILVDEAHLIPPDGEGRYQRFLKDAKIVNPRVRLGGFTATPYRTGTGMICGPDNILNHVCYEVSVKALIARGYLCKMRSKKSQQDVDLSKLHIRAGEYVESEMEVLFSADEVIVPAVAEILKVTAGRQSVLVFGASVDHCWKIAYLLKEADWDARVVVGTTPADERRETLEAFKRREFKFLVNCAVLTTGFDATCIDGVVIMRATTSPGLYYQICGRGFRLHPGKEDCLVLDYGANIARHGTVDDLRVKRKETDGTGPAPVKFCPQCEESMPAGATVCPACGHEMPRDKKMAATASDKDVVSGEPERSDWLPVQDTSYYVHTKRGADAATPKTMRVVYEVGFHTDHSEWVCVEHEGFARGKAVNWWARRCKLRCPRIAAEAVFLASHGCLAPATHVMVERKHGEKWWRVKDVKLAEIPEPPAGILDRLAEEFPPAPPAEPSAGDDAFLVDLDGGETSAEDGWRNLPPPSADDIPF